MKRLLVSLLLLLSAFAGGAALACEKHLDGHQSSSDTGAEVGGER